MVYENFTTYTEVDPNSHLTVAANHLDFVSYENEDCYLYKDFGAGHFTDFEHLVDVRMGSGDNAVAAFLYNLQNNIDDVAAIYANNYTSLGVYVYYTAHNLSFAEIYNGSVYEQYTTLSADTWYYLTISKTGTSVSCKVYSDSARTSLLTTLSFTLQADHSFRYMFPANTWNSGDNIYADNDIDNLDLQEAINRSYGVIV
ncbi:MAG: hypothetical protein SVV88_11680 [Pseudomonadota bacterium]|nr:hypothetical protein [Pseudomonadota bacterium]